MKAVWNLLVHDTFVLFASRSIITFLRIYTAIYVFLQVANGIVISANSPESSVMIRDCTFQDSYVDSVGMSSGMGGVVYATGDLTIQNSVFLDNVFSGRVMPTPAPGLLTMPSSSLGSEKVM